jgi:hypothetical protein
MTRRLLNLLTLLSLLLCLAAVVLWVRSYRRADDWGWARFRDHAAASGGEAEAVESLIRCGVGAMAYLFTATDFEADPDAVFVGFTDGTHYLWMQPDEDDYPRPRPSPDARNVWIEIDDQGWGGHGGIARVRLTRDTLTVRRTLPLEKHMGGHEAIEVWFSLSDAEFEQVQTVLRAVMRGNEHLLEIVP